MLKENLKNYLPGADSWLLPRENGMLLSDYQIMILERNNINYLDYQQVSALLFKINEVLEDDYDEELDAVSSSLDESNYYQNVNK